MFRRSVLVLSTVIGLVACGGDDGDDTTADPRCAAICQIREPALAGAYDICSAASARSCLDQCEVRIAGVETVCATCLLEGAYFGTGGDDGEGVTPCDNGTCTISGPAGSCSYPQNNQAAYEACARQVHPRREVACDVDFESTSACAPGSTP